MLKRDRASSNFLMGMIICAVGLTACFSLLYASGSLEVGVNCVCTE